MDAVAQQLIARLQRNPNDGGAYEELKSHYRRSGDRASLANLLEGWAGAHADDWERAADAYCEAGQLAVELGDTARGAASFRLALQANALHPEAGNELIALLERAGDAQQLGEFLDSYARALEPVAGTAEYVASLYRRLAQLAAQSFARPDLAAQYEARADDLLEAQAGAAGAPQPPAAPARTASSEPASDAELKAAELAAEAEACLAGGDAAGAIQALRQALAAVPGDVEVMHKLASCLLARAEQSDEASARTDQRRAAELLYQIAQAVDAEQAIEYLQAALAAMPDHDGALALLERLAGELGRTAVLPSAWVAYVAVAGEGPDLDRRRLLLGQAYLEAGQLDDAFFCLQPAAEHGNDRAHELLQAIYARQATGASAAPSEAVPAARAVSRAPDRERSESAQRIAELRKQIHDAVHARKHDEAAELCKQVLELDALDPEAFTLLESHYRKRREYPALRELLLASTRAPGLAVDARKVRLREVATLSETKLRDPEAAISAWRGVVTLDPGDREATASLKRLLKKAQQWDELASVLEREALTAKTVEEKIALLREIALLHRDRRNDRAETAEALRQLHALKPSDLATRDELCELLVALEQWHDAVPLLRDRIETSRDEVEQLRLLGELAAILHEKTSQLEEAYAVCEQILKTKQSDRATFERMENIDRETASYARLLATLERRALMAPKADRPGLFVRMGMVAELELQDLDKAADYFGDALDLAPDHAEAMQHLVEMFERAGRYDQLVELLRERALLEREPRARAPLFRRIAETLDQKLGDEGGAAEAYRKLLDLEEDELALRFLLRRAEGPGGSPEELCDCARRLHPLVHDDAERRSLLLTLALTLHEQLGKPAEASAALKRLLEGEATPPPQAVELLLAISESTGDKNGLAVGLEQKLQLMADPAERRATAVRLADLWEHELHEPARAITALRQWAKEDAYDPAPQRRLRTLLEQEGRFGELLTTLDALAECEDDFNARDEATIAAATVAFDRLGDAQGAWRRLEPLVAQRNEEAARTLREIALGAKLEGALCALYVDLAQQSDDPATQAAHWSAATDLFEHALGDPAQALEASLRLLATDLGNRNYLARVEGLVQKTQAYRRIAAVYDRLLKNAADDAEKVELLRRYAALLEREHPEDALDRILRACALAPQDDALMAHAEQLAERTDRSEELLVVYDRKRGRVEDDVERTQLLLRAARLCDGPLRDRERANQYLKTALAAAGDAEACWALVEAAAKELDSTRPELGADAARKSLVRSMREVAERMEQATAVRLFLRAANLLRAELGDDRGAFDLLRHALAEEPRSDEVFAALLELAEGLKRMDAVDAHLSRLIDETIEPQVTVSLLRRRGALLEGPLNRFQDAAAVYTKLLQVRPDDAEASEKLIASLRRSGRHQDLLLVLNKQLQRARDPQRRVELLQQIAGTWERDIKNRWEALDAWKTVLRESPADEQALLAVERISKAKTSPGAVATPEVERPLGEAAAAEHEPAAPAPPDPSATGAGAALASPTTDAGSSALDAVATPVDPGAEDTASTAPKKRKGGRKGGKRGGKRKTPPPERSDEAVAVAEATAVLAPATDPPPEPPTAEAEAPAEAAAPLAEAATPLAEALDEAPPAPPDASAAPPAPTTPVDFAAAPSDAAPEREPEPVRDTLPDPPAPALAASPSVEAAEESEGAGDLDALDSVLGSAHARPEELDLLEPGADDIEVEIAPVAPRPPLPSLRGAPPVPPPRSIPLPPLRTSAGPVPPPPARENNTAVPRSVPPPPRVSSHPPALPPPLIGAEGRSSSVPPLPPRPSASPPRFPSRPLSPPRPATVEAIMVSDDEVQVVDHGHALPPSRPAPPPARTSSRPPPLPPRKS